MGGERGNGSKWWTKWEEGGEMVVNDGPNGKGGGEMVVNGGPNWVEKINGNKSWTKRG